MKKATFAALLCLGLIISLTGCTTRAAVAQHPIVTEEELAALYAERGTDPDQALPAAELMPSTPTPTATPAAEKKAGGLFSGIKKTTSSPSPTPSPSPEAGASPDTTATAAAGLFSATPTPYSGAYSIGSVTVSPTPTAKATAKATASPTPASSGLTSADIASVLNQAFAEEGYSDMAHATASGNCVTVKEQAAFPYSEYENALQNDPQGDVATEISGYLTDETAYWAQLFSEIVSETGYHGRFVMVFVFSDGVEYTGLDTTL